MGGEGKAALPRTQLAHLRVQSCSGWPGNLLVPNHLCIWSIPPWGRGIWSIPPWGEGHMVHTTMGGGAYGPYHHGGEGHMVHTTMGGGAYGPYHHGGRGIWSIPPWGGGAYGPYHHGGRGIWSIPPWGEGHMVHTTMGLPILPSHLVITSREFTPI